VEEKNMFLFVSWFTYVELSVSRFWLALVFVLDCVFVI